MQGEGLFRSVTARLASGDIQPMIGRTPAMAEVEGIELNAVAITGHEVKAILKRIRERGGGSARERFSRSLRPLRRCDGKAPLKTWVA